MPLPVSQEAALHCFTCFGEGAAAGLRMARPTRHEKRADRQDQRQNCYLLGCIRSHLFGPFCRWLRTCSIQTYVQAPHLAHLLQQEVCPSKKALLTGSALPLCN